MTKIMHRVYALAGLLGEKRRIEQRPLPALPGLRQVREGKASGVTGGQFHGTFHEQV
jgi:hypothetical protein